jgi:uncharacterized membrane protein
MLIFITGIIILIGIHLVPSFPVLREKFIDQLGLWPYKGIFALVALTGLLLIIFGKASAEIIPVWEPPEWSRHIPLTIMPVSLVLIIAAYMPSNIKRFTPHPMLWGVAIWAATHLAANGDLVSIILFSSLGLYALFDIWSADNRGSKKSEVVLSPVKDVIVIVSGLVFYSIVLVFHEHITGMSVI